MTGMAIATQEAVFRKLDASLVLDNFLARHENFDRAGIYDFVPSSAQSGNNHLFPMVTIGEDQPAELDTDDSVGGDIVVSIHIWSRSPSWFECKRIADAVRDVLQRQTLDVPDHHFIGMDWTDDDYIRDPDGITLQVISRYRLQIERIGLPGPGMLL